MNPSTAADTVERLAALGEIAAETAHELGSVLQVLSSSAYVARREVDHGDTAAAMPHLERIERHARMAHAIVDGLMALARGEPLPKEEVTLAALLETARAGMPPDAATWDDRIEPRDLQVLAHVHLFARLLRVLFDNAIAASQPRRPVIVTHAGAYGSHAVVDVVDDGPGVPAAIATTLFDPFVTARPGGTGLGLALARRIVRAHGGSIALLSNAESGAHFGVELPLRE